MADEQRQGLLSDDDDGVALRYAPESLDVRLATAFLILGAGMLWPFNSFITANEFLGKIFQDDRWLLSVYSPTITFLFTFTNLLSTIYFTQTVRKADLNVRITASSITTSVLFVLLSILTMAELPARIYFWILIVIVAVTGISTGALQNGCFGIVGGYHPRYVPFIMIGQGIAGVTPAILSIVVALIGGESSDSVNSRAFSYFLSSSLVLASSYFAHLFLKSQREKDVPADAAAPPFELYGRFLRSYHPWTVFLVFAVTLSVFPSLTASVRSVLPSEEGVPFADVPRLLQPAVFVPLGFLLWNGGDLLARVLTALPPLEIENPRILFLASLARILWIPATFLCNVRGGGAIVKSDAFFFGFMLLFGMSNGYLGSLTMAAAIKQSENKRDVGAFMSFMLCSGLVVGSLLSFLF